MIRTFGRSALTVVHELGEISLFGAGALRGFFGQRHRVAKLIVATHEIGVRCFPIVAIVGLFTGLVMVWPVACQRNRQITASFCATSTIVLGILFNTALVGDKMGEASW